LSFLFGMETKLRTMVVHVTTLERLSFIAVDNRYHIKIP
jgi:hypothetical protein